MGLHGRRKCAFTLVELLVVIGIIALLLAILLPVISRAREAANRVKCLANLRSMAQAAMLHAQEHQGYMPVAGFQWIGGASADGLGDTRRVRYQYVYDGSTLRPVPLTISLGSYMGAPVKYGNVVETRDTLTNEELRRLFTCPSQVERRWGQSVRARDRPTTFFVSLLQKSLYEAHHFHSFRSRTGSGSGAGSCALAGPQTRGGRDRGARGPPIAQHHGRA